MTKEELRDYVDEQRVLNNIPYYVYSALIDGIDTLEPSKGTSNIQAIYTEALEEGIRCAMCTNTIKSDTGCDGGCIVDTKMYNKVMTEINSRLLRRLPREGHWIKEESPYGWDGHSYQCSECGRSIHLDTEMEDLEDYPYCHCGADMREVLKDEIN